MTENQLRQFIAGASELKETAAALLRTSLLGNLDYVPGAPKNGEEGARAAVESLFESSGIRIDQLGMLERTKLACALRDAELLSPNLPFFQKP